MDIQTALSNLYNASRLAPLTADQHDKLHESAEALHAHITPTDTNNGTTEKDEAKNAEKS